MAGDSSIDLAHDFHDYGCSGKWNDLGMLLVGLKGKGQFKGGGLSFIEYYMRMSIWDMTCSPLTIGRDIRNLDKESASLLMIREVLAVN